MAVRHCAHLLLVVGCAAPQAIPTPAPLPTDELAEGPGEVRHNPARCPCPPWEVRVGRRWERVHVEDVSEEGTYVEALARRAGDDDRRAVDGRYWVAVELTKRVHAYRGGGRFRVLEVRGDPIPPDEPADSVEAEDAAQEAEPAPAPSEPGPSPIAPGPDPVAPSAPSE